MILVGTSGYNYPEWKGSFYPADLPATKMLPYYASKFPTVEINYTFYRMPTPKLVAGWRAQVPPEFRFTLKAPKRITHDKRLRAAEVAESAAAASSTAAAELGPQLAALLFQLPPNFKKDLVLLNEFLSLLPPKTTAAFEFRNASWLEDDVFEALTGAQHRAVHRRQRDARDPDGDAPPTTPTCGCATRAMAMPTSRSGPRPRSSWPRPRATCSSISSTKTKARARRSASR